MFGPSGPVWYAMWHFVHSTSACGDVRWALTSGSMTAWHVPQNVVDSVNSMARYVVPPSTVIEPMAMIAKAPMPSNWRALPSSTCTPAKPPSAAATRASRQVPRTTPVSISTTPPSATDGITT